MPYHFDTPVLVPELASPSQTDNPTLTGDLLEIYFTTDRVSGNGDVWFATRATATAPFGTPAPVTAVNGELVRDQLGNLHRRADLVVRVGSRRWPGQQRHLGVATADARVGLVASGERGGAQLAGRRHPTLAGPARAGDADGLDEDDGDQSGLGRQLPDLPGDTREPGGAVRGAGGDPGAGLRRPQHGRRVPDRRRADDVFLVGPAVGAGRRGGVSLRRGQDCRRRRRQLGSVRRLAALDQRAVLRSAGARQSQHAGRRARSLAHPRRDDALLHLHRGGALNIYTAAVKPR